ncbi:MAG: HAD family hydrolase [Planctomycetota bacterium]|nr:HAD family hydrolase [Planctomycetota bacterium]
MTTQAVIFDLFGTLMELKQHRRPFYKLLRRMGFTEFREARRIAMSFHDDKVRAYLRSHGLQQESLLLDCVSEIRADCESARLFPETLEVLGALRERGVKVGILSNVSDYYVEPFYKYELDKRCDAFVMSCDEGMIKPDAEIYQLMLDRLQCSPEQAWMVGDNLQCDVQGPQKMGISAVLLDRSGQRPGIKNLMQILSLITGPDVDERPLVY